MGTLERRIEALEADGPAARFVVAVCGMDESPEQAIERETAGRLTDENTLVCCIRLFSVTRDEYLRRRG